MSEDIDDEYLQIVHYNPQNCTIASSIIDAEDRIWTYTGHSMQRL